VWQHHAAQVGLELSQQALVVAVFGGVGGGEAEVIEENSRCRLRD
jgi:hypothetical protein